MVYTPPPPSRDLTPSSEPIRTGQTTIGSELTRIDRRRIFSVNMFDMLFVTNINVLDPPTSPTSVLVTLCCTAPSYCLGSQTKTEFITLYLQAPTSATPLQLLGPVLSNNLTIYLSTYHLYLCKSLTHTLIYILTTMPIF